MTEREREILRLLAVGVSATDELADRLYISQKDGQRHLASIFQKLAVSDRTQTAIEAIRLGIARPHWSYESLSVMHMEVVDGVR